MTADAILKLLQQVAAGEVPPDAAVATLSPMVSDMGFATLDLDRAARCGFPEVVLAEGKTAEWTAAALTRLQAAGHGALATRVSPEQAQFLAKTIPSVQLDTLARTAWLPPSAGERVPRGDVLVVTAGTSDLPVAQEAAVTARVMGAGVELIADVGVAGLHRLLRHTERLQRADVVIVVAGMDGALPSVVGGLVACPVIAVPTSTGYGAAFGGVAALLTMLNSCSAGVVCVNIDAGFKAGYAAARIIARLNAGPGAAGP